MRLFEYCCGYAVGGDGHCLPVVSVVGELEVSFAVCCIELERVSAVDAVEGYGALLGVVDDDDNYLSLRSQISGGICSVAYVVGKLFAVSRAVSVVDILRAGDKMTADGDEL